MIIQGPVDRGGNTALQSFATDSSSEERCTRCFSKGPEHDSDSYVNIFNNKNCKKQIYLIEANIYLFGAKCTLIILIPTAKCMR